MAIKNNNKMSKLSAVPYHVALIMDGNGRWAEKRGLPRNFGHKRGIDNVQKVIKSAKDRGVRILSLFAFSTENWSRPKEEIDFLFSSFKKYLSENKGDKDIRFNVMGSRRGLPEDLISGIDEAVEETKDNDKIILNIAFNYGGRDEIVFAAKRIAEDFKEGSLSLKSLDERFFQGYLYDPFIPDVDLLIRTSGEERISNFMLWRIAYAELYFTNVLWPDFTAGEFDKALDSFKMRERRFGKV